MVYVKRVSKWSHYLLWISCKMMSIYPYSGIELQLSFPPERTLLNVKYKSYRAHPVFFQQAIIVTYLVLVFFFS